MERGIIMFPRGPRIPMHQMNRFNSFMPYNQMARPMPRRGAGGLLSKLFPRQGASGVSRMMGQQGGGNFLANLTNPANAGSMLNNIQKVMNVANQVGPMVQQYGPMIRNIPSLIKLYKELSADDETEEVAPTEEKEVPAIPDADENNQPEATNKGTSKPKLYI
jgi:hypothetical protein